MPVDILKHLGSCMRDARRECNLTQEQLAEKAQVSARHIAKIEKGIMNPSFEILYSLINVLGMSSDILFHLDLPDEEMEIKKLVGYYESCNLQNRQLIQKMVQCMAMELAGRQRTETSDDSK